MSGFARKLDYRNRKRRFKAFEEYWHLRNNFLMKTIIGPTFLGPILTNLESANLAGAPPAS